VGEEVELTWGGGGVSVGRRSQLKIT